MHLCDKVGNRSLEYRVYAGRLVLSAPGQMASAGGMGKTTTEMQRAQTFLVAGWEFVDEVTNGAEDLWWIDEGKDYPRLWWEAVGN
ncbi:MAG: hypothetical protein M1376_18275 [Planctomycetes bacterium]|nr:hypothetical protein [Planctomycetota bacterium]